MTDTTTAPTAVQRWMVMGMADCKACGAWFSSTAPSELCPTCERALKRLDGYVVSRGVVDQIRWERDTAIGQLEEHGIPFCGKAPDVVKVVRCKDCKHWRENTLWCDMNSRDRETWHNWYEDDFCSYGERREGE